MRHVTFNILKILILFYLIITHTYYKMSSIINTSMNDNTTEHNTTQPDSVIILLKQRKKLEKDIYKMNKLVAQNKKTIKQIERDLWTNCKHIWVYDTWSGYDDKTKYICDVCRCYRNASWYR